MLKRKNDQYDLFPGTGSSRSGRRAALTIAYIDYGVHACVSAHGWLYTWNWVVLFRAIYVATPSRTKTIFALTGSDMKMDCRLYDVSSSPVCALQ